MMDISAREAFELYQVVATAMSDDKDAKRAYLVGLTDRAFKHEPEVYAQILTSIVQA